MAWAKGSVYGPAVDRPERRRKAPVEKMRDIVLMDLAATGRSWRQIGKCLAVAHTTAARRHEEIPDDVYRAFVEARRCPLLDEPTGFLTAVPWRDAMMRKLARLGYTTREIGSILNVSHMTAARRIGPRRRRRAA